MPVDSGLLPLNTKDTNTNGSIRNDQIHGFDPLPKLEVILV
jgi:hypothetical protein